MPTRSDSVAVDEPTVESSRDESLKGRAVEGKLYIKTCPECKGSISFVGNDLPKECPHCKLGYWFKPRDERSLFALQDRYMSNGRRQEDLGAMYLEMRHYAYNILKKRAMKKKAFSKAFLEEKSSDAANRLIERYLKVPDYHIYGSFGMMLSKGLGFIYDKRDLMIDQAVSLDQPFFENGSKIIDNLSRLKLGAPEIFYEKVSRPSDEVRRSVSNICKVLNQIHDTIHTQQDHRSAILFLVGIRLQLFARRPAHASEKFYATFGADARSNIEHAELLMRNMMKEGALL